MADAALGPEAPEAANWMRMSWPPRSGDDFVDLVRPCRQLIPTGSRNGLRRRRPYRLMWPISPGYAFRRRSRSSERRSGRTSEWPLKQNDLLCDTVTPFPQRQEGLRAWRDTASYACVTSRDSLA